MAAGSGNIKCVAVWPRSRYELLRKPIEWTSQNTMAFDYCDGKPPKDCYYKSAKAAQREFYEEYKQKI